MVLESVNFHFWSTCNFNCLYCYSRFRKGIPDLSEKSCQKLICELVNAGIKKINFAGGEPTLSPFLGSLLSFSKGLDLTTSIISNGTGITRNFLKNYGKFTDWIGLSIDSQYENINFKMGRGRGRLVEKICTKAKMIRETGIKLKINTVVTKLNYQENMTSLVYKLNPDRWKIFQVLEILNQSQEDIEKLRVSQEEFRVFTERHSKLRPIVENNDLMLNSYMMVDPRGRFYQNTENSYVFSRSILECGVENALKEVYLDRIKFLKRGGNYAW